MVDAARDEALDRWLESGNERSVLRLKRVQRAVWALGVLLFLATLATGARAAWARYRGPLLDVALVVIAAAVVLRFVVRWADRRAMRRDLPLLEAATRPGRRQP